MDRRGKVGSLLLPGVHVELRQEGLRTLRGELSVLAVRYKCHDVLTELRPQLRESLGLVPAQRSARPPDSHHHGPCLPPDVLCPLQRRAVQQRLELGSGEVLGSGGLAGDQPRHGEVGIAQQPRHCSSHQPRPGREPGHLSLCWGREVAVCCLNGRH